MTAGGATEAPAGLVGLRPPTPGGGVSRWEVNFPDDIEDVLCTRYSDLEDVLAAVPGVWHAFMEDRDRGVLEVGPGVDPGVLERNVRRAVEGLRGGPQDG